MSKKASTETTYWKSFEELARDPAVLEQLQHDFSADDGTPGADAGGINRRTFMGLLAASMALAAAGCRRPEQEIVPYVRKPEYLIPGIANHFATSFAHGNVAQGLLVRSREGRPVKIDGNDLDPVSRGKSTVLAQASLLALYDPDRTLRPQVNGSDSTPGNAIERIAAAVRDTAARGKAVRIMIDEHASPSLARILARLEVAIPDCRVVCWPSITSTAAAEANRDVLGVDAVLVPDLSKADTILSIESDFLGTDPDAIWHIRGFASKRKPSIAAPAMSRFYAAEAAATLTGSNADHRVRLRPTEINEFLLAVLHELVIARGRGSFDAALTAELARHANPDFPFIAQIADDLTAKQGVVMIGRHLPVETHVLGILANQVLGAYGEGRPIDPARALPFSRSKRADMRRLRDELARGDVGMLIFGDVNPAYSMPSGAFRSMIATVLHRVSLSLYADETAAMSDIFIPVNHFLESWGDTLSLDGSQSVVQPLIAPLNDDQPSLGDVLLRLLARFDPAAAGGASTFYDVVRARWRDEVHAAAGGDGDFRTFWDDALRNGTVPTPPAPRTAAFSSARALPHMRRAAAPPAQGIQIGILPGNTLYDGRYANLGWLQELPDPVTKVTWENVAMMSRATAASLGVKKEDVIRVTTAGGSIDLPVFIQPGMGDGAIVTTAGHGRAAGGRVLAGAGANAFRIVPQSDDSTGWFPASVERTGRTARIATTQDHHALSGPDLYGIDRSDIVKNATLADFLRDPASLFAHEAPVVGAPKEMDRPISIVPGFDYSKGHRWGMTIDASACVGCNACVVACVAENNIPMVGKQQVLNGREMHWIRIDRYYAGDEDNPGTLLQPMLCQHCENAPCENVCPVAATTHSPEGLNEMTYNRCVGTRYCSNNCPYKVRRFNFLNWHADDRDPLPMVFNPDVSVRMRGVMEKCTFCVHRIDEAKFHAKNEGRDLLRDGEVTTACQQACPADAIVFGNTNDPESRVSKLRESERGYLVLRELNVRPSITYLAKIRNTRGGNA